MPGLRERRRLAAMRTIQEQAIDLFDARGFSAVTIEEIAAAADVSPSSVYRYFGTKEGIVVADEFERLGADAIGDLLDPRHPIDSLLSAVRAYEAEGGDAGTALAPRRVRYFFAEPSVREAVLAVLDRSAQRLAPVLADAHGLGALEARALTSALVFGYFAALEQWHVDGGEGSIAAYVERALAPLRSAWPAGGE